MRFYQQTWEFHGDFTYRIGMHWGFAHSHWDVMRNYIKSMTFDGGFTNTTGDILGV